MRKKFYGILNNVSIIFLEFNKIIELPEIGTHKKGFMIAGDGKGERILVGSTCRIIFSFPFFQTLLYFLHHHVPY